MATRRCWRKAIQGMAAGLLLGACAVADAETTRPAVVDDPGLDAAVTSAREEFLKGKTFDRLNATILVKQADGSWKRGSYGPDELAYPASCVKLPYMAAAMSWLREQGRPADDLDYCVGPMIKVSDNFQTGVVVDAITSQPNVADLVTSSDERYASWLEARMYTARFLDGADLLDGQTILHKTYPTNSGEWPNGAEKVARDSLGMNMMKPKASAALILGIVEGTVESWARDYMMDLLAHNPRKGSSVAGFGIPPGSLYFNKSGLAYDTLEDIAFVVLPNGRQFILAVFSNAFCPPYSKDPFPHNASQLGGFTELLIQKAGLGEGLPPRVVVDNKDAGFAVTGEWDVETSAPDKVGPDFVFKKAGKGKATAVWNLAVPEAGKYEVSLSHPQSADYVPDARVQVFHRDGVDSATLDLSRVGGRWIRLGDYEFEKGAGRVEMSDASSSSTAVLVADAVRAVRWPDTAVTTPTLSKP